MIMRKFMTFYMFSLTHTSSKYTVLLGLCLGVMLCLNSSQAKYQIHQSIFFKPILQRQYFLYISHPRNIFKLWKMYDQTRCSQHLKRKFKQIKKIQTPHNISQEQSEIFPQTEEYIQSLMAVFGHDSLAQRTAQTEKLFPKAKHQFGIKVKKNTEKKTKKADKDFITKTLADISQILPFENNMNFGSNSNKDIYVEMSANQNWILDPKLKIDTSQTYRYATDSRNYLSTDLKLTHTQSKEAALYNQLKVTRSSGDENYYWSDKTYQQYQFVKNNLVIIGVYTSGHYNREWTLNSWGPYISWKQPIWRNWLFLQTDLTYYNDKGSDLDHRISSSFGFEAHF